MAEQQSNLRSLYSTAKQYQKQLDTLQSNSDQYQENLRAAISILEECRKLASELSLFSPNETEDDISSNDLQYLSIDYDLADLIPRTANGDRKMLLERSREAYERYLDLLDSYDMLSPSDHKLYERYREDKSHFTLLAGSDPSSKRDTKIARFKQEKGLRDKLSYLNSSHATLQNDDSLLRSLHTSTLSLQTHQTFQALDFMAQELTIISLAPQMPPEPSPSTDPRLRPTSDSTYSSRLDPPLSSLLANGRAGPILDKSGKPLQPFVLLDKRQELRKGVFKPGHNLPTMSIDEYLEEEKRRGGIIEGGGENPQKVVDEDDLEAADRETMKKREWDEYVEANPKGSGNTLNRG